jgi:D-tyrosyl-tRNA(Tyr) deacylase
MRAVVQRVAQAAVSVEEREVARIGRGFLVLAGFGRDDTSADLEWMARKIASLRIFEDESGRMSRSLDAVGGEILVVSQFTLYADVRKGARPGFDDSAPPEVAHDLYQRFVEALRSCSSGRVATGEFQAVMRVSLVNEGPVTLVIERPERR